MCPFFLLLISGVLWSAKKLCTMSAIHTESKCPIIRLGAVIQAASLEVQHVLRMTPRPRAAPSSPSHTPKSPTEKSRVLKCPFMRLCFFLLSVPSRTSAALVTHRVRYGQGGIRCQPGMRAATSCGGGGNSKGGVAVLGAGWAGSRLASRLLEDGHSVSVTNRPATGIRRKDAYFQPMTLPPEVPRHAFDMNDPETWSSLPPPESLSAAVLTFTTSQVHCEAFWKEYLQHVPRVVCYSSTSVYRVDTPGQLVNEDTPLRDTPRARAEKFMQDRGATMLTISGIFDDVTRGVCSSLAAYAKTCGALNGQKSVNMVHVDDIVDATIRMLEQPSPQSCGQRVNLGGEHFLLSELCEHCAHPVPPESSVPDLGSKRVSSERVLRDVLPPGFTFTSPMDMRQPVRQE